MKSTLHQFQKHLIARSYSENTVKTYTTMLKAFLKFMSRHENKGFSENLVIEYHAKLIKHEKYSSSYINQSINAIKFYAENLLNLPKKSYDIHRPRKSKKLPKVLNQHEIRKILDVTKNIKHKAILCIIYSSGLRISECINLKISDIDSKNMIITIRQGKGRKDRITVLSEQALLILRDYYKKYQPKLWLFEGTNQNRYSTTSIRKIFKKSKINSYY